ALRDAGESLDKGDLVCLFPEGQITRTGMMQTFRRGVERNAKGRQAPIIPIHLDHLWGSLFSFEGGRFLWKSIRQLPYRVSVVYGQPLPPDTPVPLIRKAIHDLSADAWQLRRDHRRPLHHSFARACRRNPFRLFLVESGRPAIRRLKALASTLALARTLRGPWQGQSHVGILLPPGIAGAMANLAAAFAGKTSVNLNFTAGTASLASACHQAGLRTVLTHRLFIDKTKTTLPPEMEAVWIEDVIPTMGPLLKLRAFLAAIVLPVRMLESFVGATRHPTLDDTATVIFSSGSTGEPKGVELTHFNIDSNVEAAAQVFRAGSHDRILGILPLFHSFGMMAMWYASNHGLGLVCHATPLDAAAIGELVQEHEVTMLLATPTFLQLYMRRCTPAQFGSLRLVMTGAEKLPEKLAETFDAQFGIRPLEGYGATECAPAIAVSAPDYRASGFYQPGSRRGSVGQAIPGMAVKLVDPETRNDLPMGVPGLLLVKGPSVMKGYLDREDLTRAAFHEGWYVTGDIAALDEDGFIRITDRMSRFSKIGGEMVPHGRIEQALQEASKRTDPLFAVTAIPDERKGERLVVLHACPGDVMDEALAVMSTMGFPNLYMPQRRLCFEVGSLPLLGSGKADLKAIRQWAVQAVKDLEDHVGNSDESSLDEKESQT
ncbi:MAG: AMP-binding protein, partial [Planctomycetota bacterium]